MGFNTFHGALTPPKLLLLLFLIKLKSQENRNLLSRRRPNRISHLPSIHLTETRELCPRSSPLFAVRKQHRRGAKSHAAPHQQVSVRHGGQNCQALYALNTHAPSYRSNGVTRTHTLLRIIKPQPKKTNTKKQKQLEKGGRRGRRAELIQSLTSSSPYPPSSLGCFLYARCKSRDIKRKSLVRAVKSQSRSNS